MDDDPDVPEESNGDVGGVVAALIDVSHQELGGTNEGCIIGAEAAAGVGRGANDELPLFAKFIVVVGDGWVIGEAVDLRGSEFEGGLRPFDRVGQIALVGSSLEGEFAVACSERGDIEGILDVDERQDVGGNTVGVDVKFCFLECDRVDEGDDVAEVVHTRVKARTFACGCVDMICEWVDQHAVTRVESTQIDRRCTHAEVTVTDETFRAQQVGFCWQTERVVDLLFGALRDTTLDSQWTTDGIDSFFERWEHECVAAVDEVVIDSHDPDGLALIPGVVSAAISNKLEERLDRCGCRWIDVRVHACGDVRDPDTILAGDGQNSTGHQHVVATGRCNGCGDRSSGNVGAFTETSGIGVGVSSRRAEFQCPDFADLGEAAELDGESVRDWQCLERRLNDTVLTTSVLELA